MATIDVKELHQQIQSDKETVLIDVRTPAEYAQAHVAGAKLYPITDFDANALLDELKAIGHENQTLYIICRGGPRSETACQMLHEAQYDNAVFVEGGIDAWIKAGYPVIKEKRAFSVQRQYQLLIGVFVFIFTLAGLIISRWFYTIPLLIGAALIYAGYSGSCMLTNVLSKMPWNKQ